jgi:D-glycero-D-manno-heptose 1,7-bisphosphate phosphatase
MKTAFLDRDGVLNMDRGEYTWLPSQWHFVPEVSASLRVLVSKGYQLIVITNQAGISKGLYTRVDVLDLHRWMCDILTPEGISFKDIFFCPYHDSFSASIWRKPESGMLERAMALYEILPEEAVFIGDADRDMAAAQKVGVREIKVVANQSWIKVAESL